MEVGRKVWLVETFRGGLPKGRPKLFRASSLNFPTVFSNLAAKPTTTVGVLRRYYNVFEFQQDGELYYAFFGLRGLKENQSNDARLSLFVESAYPRPDKIISRRKVSFGMLAEVVASGEKL